MITDGSISYHYYSILVSLHNIPVLLKMMLYSVTFILF